MANAYVFPGGRLDPTDCEPAMIERVVGDRGPLREAMSGGLDESEAVGHVVAAVRETFEEAGILLARCGDEVLASEGSDARRLFETYRDHLNAGEKSFLEILDESDLSIRLLDLKFFANWITPTVEKRRYNARFFIAVAPEKQVGKHDEIETTDSVWLTARDAIEAYEKGGFDLAPPTWRIVKDLASFVSVESILTWASQITEVPAIMPHFTKVDGLPSLALPGDTEHPESRGSGVRNRVVMRDGRWREG